MDNKFCLALVQSMICHWPHVMTIFLLLSVFKDSMPTLTILSVHGSHRQPKFQITQTTKSIYHTFNLGTLGVSLLTKRHKPSWDLTLSYKGLRPKETCLWRRWTWPVWPASQTVLRDWRRRWPKLTSWSTMLESCCVLWQELNKDLRCKLEQITLDTSISQIFYCLWSKR